MSSLWHDPRPTAVLTGSSADAIANGGCHRIEREEGDVLLP
jgi:hypothetical protein